MKRVTAKWESEAAMLTAFAELARTMGFRVVPEACGHDLLLVAGDELRGPNRYEPAPDAIEPGDVIAVEGKLRGSVTALRQALPPYRRKFERMSDPSSAADFYAVVIPERDDDFESIAIALDVSVWVMRPPQGDPEHWGHRPAELQWFNVRHGSRVVGHPRLDVPALDVAITPGLPAPRRLTPWKVGAVRLCLLAAQRPLTVEDFARTPVSVRSLADRGWITREGRGKTATFRLLEHPTRPDLAYPEIAAAIVAQDPVVVEAEAPAMRGALWSCL